MKVHGKKTERQATNAKKVFVNHISDRRLVSKIYFKTLKVNQQKVNNPTKSEMGKTHEGTFQPRGYTDGK